MAAYLAARVSWFLVFGAINFSLCKAHGEPGKSMDCPITDRPVIHSYHLHMFYWPDGDFAPDSPQNQNDHNQAGAFRIQQDFMERFNMTQEPNCTSLREDRFCRFDIISPGFEWDEPFVELQWSIGVPVRSFDVVLKWIMMNRGTYDIFFHPNTGCVVNDHRDWPIFAGHKHQIKLSTWVEGKPDGTARRLRGTDHARKAKSKMNTSQDGT
eukprot:TRINITY_DN4749_c1_g2_i1.p1 TRINITY_DN4749_c1_g2~~TRINITY_DN4749_c1_g2_i1.p1  ORF type:complete len:211 (-),score=30.64 TRINITY_DN4749_c1_g2_i1:393-1025(-)